MRIGILSRILCVFTVVGSVFLIRLLNVSFSLSIETEPEQFSLPTSKTAASIINTKKSRRKFLNYSSSRLERIWKNKIRLWTARRSICTRVNIQRRHFHRYFRSLCTTWAPPPYSNWCVIDDSFIPLWYNTNETGNFNVTFQRPIPYPVQMPPPKPVQPSDHAIFSKYTFLDEITGETYVEFIEPLTAALRFPLAKCHPAYNLTIFRGYVIPPPNLERHKDAVYYFDAGASSWADGWGGPSLKYFVDMWKRHGVDFRQIFAWEISTTPKDFYATVPDEYKDRVFYNQTAVVSQAQDETEANPFPPNFIQRTVAVAGGDAYRLFKLDIDTPIVEDGSIRYILENPERLVDELFWEHHCNSYLLKIEWGRKHGRLQLWDSYDLFLQLRHKGIRAHSWI